jgi:integrase
MSATVFKRPGGSYYVRLFFARQELWISLRTKDEAEARLRGAVLGGRVASAKLVEGGGPRMTREDMKRIVRQFVSETIEQGEEDRASRTRITENEREAIGLGLSDAFDNTLDQLQTNNLTPIAATVDELLKTHGLALQKDSMEYRVLSRLVLQGRMAALKIDAERWSGEEGEPVSLTVSGNGAVFSNSGESKPSRLPSATERGSNATTKLLSDVITAYFRENKREPRTDSQIKSGFNKFITAIGGDCPIGDITKDQCRTYKEWMASQGLSGSSVNKYLAGLSHLLAWAKGQGFVPDGWANPVEGLRVKKQRGDKRQKRSPFTDAELTAIFDSPHFIQQRTKRPERFWLPLCLLWSGGRREELAQLYLDDVHQEKGVWVFDIRANEVRGQGLKNEASERMVPVHSRLIELGFLMYVEHTRATGAVRLFPKLKHGANGYGDAVGKFFARHLKQLGIVDPSKVLHSLRHTAITRLHSRGVPQNIAEALVGHAANTVHGSVYLHRNALPMKLLKDGIERLDFRVHHR